MVRAMCGVQLKNRKKIYRFDVDVSMKPDISRLWQKVFIGMVTCRGKKMDIWIK